MRAGAYRPDIDGLRAIAVLAVVAYHAFPQWVPGGFLGVDVFFVISGYLITSLIVEGLKKGSFSLSQFYGRRIRRIFPSLLVVVLATYAFGWFALIADEYAELGKHIAAGAAFVSNLVLWGESGYFDRSSETKPLLHLWSLGIEEQFYIVWPLLLWLAWKRKFAMGMSLALAAVSLLMAFLWSKVDAVAMFYSPLTRFWELLAGCLLATSRVAHARVHPAAANVASGAGLALLAGTSLFIAQGANFSAGLVAAAVIGAALIIAAGPQAVVNRRVLSNPVAVWFGLISFPLYLWHWPLLSYARIVGGAPPGPALAAAAVASALALSWLTYTMVEMPVRFGANAKAKVVACAVLMTLVCGIGLYTYGSAGMGTREVARLNSALMHAAGGGDQGLSTNKCDITDASERRLFSFCARDRRGNIRFALLGDSKAAAMYAALLRTSTNSGRWMFIGGSSKYGAPIPLLSGDPLFAKFQPLTTVAVRAIEKNDEVRDVVIVAAIRSLFQLSDGVKDGNMANYDHRYLKQLQASANYDRVLDGFSQTVSHFVRSGKKVVLVVDNPALPSAADCSGRRTSLEFVNRLLTRNADCVVPLSVFESEIAMYRKLLSELEERYGDAVEIFDPTDIYCDVAKGTCGPEREGRLLYSVTDHISDYAAGLVATRLNSDLSKNLALP